MRLALLALFSAMIWLVAQAFAAQPPPSFVIYKVPKPVPELQFTDGEGKTRTLAEFKGKVVLLNIWATWCLPCRKEFPTLDRLQATLGGPDFEVVPVSIDSKGMPAIDKFYGEISVKNLARYVTPSGNGALDTLGIFGIPATLLIDPEGQEIGRVTGPAEWDSPDFVAFLKDVITKQKETSQ